MATNKELRAKLREAGVKEIEDGDRGKVNVSKARSDALEAAVANLTAPAPPQGKAIDTEKVQELLREFNATPQEVLATFQQKYPEKFELVALAVQNAKYEHAIATGRLTAVDPPKDDDG
ncbi:MAG: hypothetical protein R3320_11060 [Nitriliruptorales bacterium]|nr:hypothetical protein [Nitriliruptorales bacterium]